jgi:hypothetical protein
MRCYEGGGIPLLRSAAQNIWEFHSSGRKTGDILWFGLGCFDAECFRGHCKCLFMRESGIEPQGDGRLRGRLLIPSGSRA